MLSQRLKNRLTTHAMAPLYALAAAAIAATAFLAPASAAPHPAAATKPARAVQVDDLVPHRNAAVAHTIQATRAPATAAIHHRRLVITTTAGAKRYARSLLSARQYACLNNIYMRESGWDIHAWNPEGAYGIPQAYPGWKMRTFGSDWRWNAATQINWGLSYIHDRYGTPCSAWAFWQDHNWY
jgi:hypothetical protein